MQRSQVQIPFQLTRLMRGVTGIVKPLKMPSIFQLTRLMRGVTWEGIKSVWNSFISTHTPHARRDSSSTVSEIVPAEISTHTPHARRDAASVFKDIGYERFQLTRLMRGVTIAKVLRE